LSQVAANFGRFLPSQILKGWCPQKVVLTLLLLPSGTSHGKVSLSYPLSSKIIDAHTLHFKPILDPLCKKIVGETPFPMGCALASFGHSTARAKISGRSTPYGPKYGLPKKSIWWLRLHI